MRFTLKQVEIVRAGAANPRGVVAFTDAGTGVGLRRRAWQTNVDKLVGAGLLTPNAHGDYYVTDKGREAAGAMTADEFAKWATANFEQVSVSRRPA